MPESVVPGSAITVGWTGEFTSTNAAASPTSGNVDIAATIRGDFGDVIDGEFVADEGFGAVTIVSDDPFTVRYDLTEPSWSDGIPLDAADLLLGWAGASGYFDVGDESETADAEPDAELAVPVLDEFARAIQVTFPQPVIDWQQAVTVPVPAHIVGRLAFAMDDDMEAKQAVIGAIQEHDSAALEALATVWNEGFELSDQAELPADLMLSSGPFLVDGVDRSDAGQSVTLVPNPSYSGLVTPQVARIDMVPPGVDPIATIGDQLDAAQVAPIAVNRAPIIELERKDFTVDTTHDGTVWAMLLNPAGVFTQQQARTAFIHAVPARSMVERGAGDWATAYAGTTSMVSAPGSRAYDIVNADSGFAETLGEAGDDPALEREAAGLAARTHVCVLYDRRSEFAVGAFAALRDAAGEFGWSVVDCGSDDFDTALVQRGWDAVIARVPIPQTPGQIAAQWGSQGDASITRHADPERDALIAQLAQTTDIYEARDIRAQIEATIVRAAVALPIAANPRVTISDRDVTGVASRNGATAPLTSGAVQWAALP
ncbi:ABC transporter substrate-binding protein [Microbacterium sp. A93]|uniref:ABC transporter substrate-binding protein n=1 Tax=Microbacterium sp. A93 TaxID=3450716 RepID=UPI003F437D40